MCARHRYHSHVSRLKAIIVYRSVKIGKKNARPKMHKRTKSRGDWIEKEAYQVKFYQMSHFVRFE